MITSVELLLTTALLAVVSAVLSAVVGFPLGIWLSALGPKVARLVAAVLTVPFLLPPFLIGIAVSSWLGDENSNSSLGMIQIVLAHIFMNAGFIGRVVASRTIDVEQIDAAKLDGATDGQIRWHIQAKQLLPAITSAALLVALYCTTSYGLVLTLAAGRVKTLETEIAISALQRLDLETASTLAILQTALSIGLFLSVRRITGVESSLTEIQGSNLRVGWMAKAIGIALTSVVVILLGSVIIRAGWGQGLINNLLNLWSQGTRSLLNISVVEAALNSLRNALLVAAISIPLTLLVSKRKRRNLLAVLPAGISPVVLGLGTLLIAGYLPRELTSSWILLPLVQVIFAIPVTYQILHPARLSFESQQREAAALDGAGWLRSFLLIELPQLRRAVFLALAFAMLTSLGEFGAASFLAFGANETLPLILFQLMGRPGGDNYGMAMVAASIYILLTAWIVWFATRPERIRNPNH